MIGYDGESMAEAMRDAGLDPAKLPEARRDDIDTFIELHIEQGPILEQAGIPVGVVPAINGTGTTWWNCAAGLITLGHVRWTTGATLWRARPRSRLGVIDTALRMGRPAVTTVGRMEVEPNGPGHRAGARHLHYRRATFRPADCVNGLLPAARSLDPRCGGATRLGGKLDDHDRPRSADLRPYVSS